MACAPDQGTRLGLALRVLTMTNSCTSTQVGIVLSIRVSVTINLGRVRRQH